jgi:hypothetical protein
MATKKVQIERTDAGTQSHLQLGRVCCFRGTHARAVGRASRAASRTPGNLNASALQWKEVADAVLLYDSKARESALAEMNHSEIDQVSLEMARRVAERVRRNPELLEMARANLARWSRQNASVGSLLRCYAEWEEILARPVGEICDLLCSEAEDAQRLRQNSPFAGVLSPAEVWEIKARFHHAPTTA